jgi:glycosyltransferase involved in cell wall biosynthesis
MLYQSTSLLGKASIFIKGFLRRIKDVVRARNYDIVFIYREAFMTGSTLFERLLKQSGAKIILDFDDAIWLPTISEVNKSLQWLKRPEKTQDIVALCDLVIVGNSYLAGYAKKFNNNVAVFPSTINLDYYRIPEITNRYQHDKVLIGWSGSHTTIEHFETLLPVLKKLKDKYGARVQFMVYGDPHYNNQELEIKGVEWSDKTEVETIASFDIGIMPLPDNEWSLGKCGMKGIQYMGLGVPAVLSAVGMNKEIITHNQNGFLASNEHEWLNVLSNLIEDKLLRERIGLAGRKTVEERYSCQALQKQYVNLFLSTVGKQYSAIHPN